MVEPAERRPGGDTIPARAGIGLRSPHHEHAAAGRPAVAWLEVHTENYFHDGGPAVRALERARAHYPLSLHGVGLGLASTAPLDRAHLERVRSAVRRYEPALVSEHACWNRAGAVHYNDLLPPPHTEEAALHLAARVREVQDALGRQILVENLSSCLRWSTSCLEEWEFLDAVVAHSGCGLLLDVNNLYVNSVNLGLDAARCIDEVPAHAVREIHLAGHRRNPVGSRELLVDDHGSAVCPEVWALYERAIARFGPLPTLVEWDTNVPDVEVLVAEARKADAVMDRHRALAA
ncbi:MAG: DUF692 domain-containing protein [Steroidobacteraceae bacterium]